MIKAALILGVLAIVAAFAFGGRYNVSGQGPALYVVDRFTGSVRFCNSEECAPVPDKKDPWTVTKQEPAPWTRFQKEPEKKSP